MIISKTPFRISLLGGGTDFPHYYKNNPGLVIGGTINKFCYVTARFMPNVFDFKHRIVWSKNETVSNNNEIIHPTVRAVFNKLNIKKGLEIHYQGDLQKNSGLGTSSSFCAGLLNSIFSLQNKNINKKKLALLTLEIEQKILRENCGSQDQIWAAYGGFNSISFYKNEFKVKKINIGQKKLTRISDNLLLFYTGINKYSKIIEKSKILYFNKKFSNYEKIFEMTKQFKNEIQFNKDIDFIGSFLNDYWNLKKDLSNSVTSSYINEIYDEAISSGSLGGKLIGSGGGGFLLFYCKKRFQKKLINRLHKLPVIRFKFTNDGSKIIFNSSK